MKILFIIAIAVAALAGSRTFFNRLRTGSCRSATQFCRHKGEAPFYCDRTALTPEQRKRQQELSKILRSAVLGIQELPDGFEFEFPSDSSNYQALTEFTPLERACCPFFDISIRLEREGGKLCWSLTGREGVKQFIKAEFAPLIKP